MHLHHGLFANFNGKHFCGGAVQSDQKFFFFKQKIVLA